MIVEGVVTGGNKIGRKLGFPTANIVVDDTLAAADGVYAARVTYDGRTYDAMAYLGRKPSVGGDGKRVLEVHIFDFDTEIYGQKIAVELGRYVRADRRFDSFDELKEQLKQDKICISTKNCPTK
ncbi:MAG: riboflavin kinase [Rikenellaceae bacterium]|nr:riboflavin kinase [Rikenellaceae bacterium]